MATVQILKKKLRGIRSTEKLTKAMKTASTVKYSRLNALYKECSPYQEVCSTLYKGFGNDIMKLFSDVDSSAPHCIIVMASNKGMCGGFNSEIFSFAESVLAEYEKPPIVLICGKQTVAYFTDKKLDYKKAYIFEDVPCFENASELFNTIRELIDNKKISSVKIIYPRYLNMVKQEPTIIEFFPCNEIGSTEDDTNLYIPDKSTALKNTGIQVITSILFKYILETALGAQAATLMTMRSAYDTATEYSSRLENEINRKRQTQVTADVIETSAEHTEPEEKEE